MGLTGLELLKARGNEILPPLSELELAIIGSRLPGLERERVKRCIENKPDMLTIQKLTLAGLFYARFPPASCGIYRAIMDSGISLKTLADYFCMWKGMELLVPHPHSIDTLMAAVYRGLHSLPESFGNNLGELLLKGIEIQLCPMETLGEYLKKAENSYSSIRAAISYQNGELLRLQQIL